MEEFYAKRDEDFDKWFADNKNLIEKGLYTPKQIFEIAYTLGALQNATKPE